MKKVSVAEAKNRLTELIREVEDGESVTICRRGKPVADIVRTTKAGRERPKFGTLKRRVLVRDERWWEPMSEEEAEEFVDGS